MKTRIHVHLGFLRRYRADDGTSTIQRHARLATRFVETRATVHKVSEGSAYQDLRLNAKGDGWDVVSESFTVETPCGRNWTDASRDVSIWASGEHSPKRACRACFPNAA